MIQRCSVREITTGHADQPWITGCDFRPSGAMTGGFWLFKEQDFNTEFVHGLHDSMHADFIPDDPDEIAVLRRYNLEVT